MNGGNTGSMPARGIWATGSRSLSIQWMAAEDISDNEAEVVPSMVNRIKELDDTGLQTVDLFNCWLGRRIVPLQRRANPMYKYTGSADPTRSLSSNWEEQDYKAALKRITDTEFTGWKPSVAPYEPTNNPVTTVSTGGVSGSFCSHS